MCRSLSPVTVAGPRRLLTGLPLTTDRYGCADPSGLMWARRVRGGAADRAGRRTRSKRVVVAPREAVGGDPAKVCGVIRARGWSASTHKERGGPQAAPLATSA